MPVIDGEGLSGGRRLRRCSDTARLYWPYLFCTSNGFGRFEVDCPKIIAHCFLGFQNPPSKEVLLSCIEEYRQADLLFTWVFRGETWGQWDTKDKFLKRHKTASDRESPEPPATEFAAWKKRISENKGLQNFSAQVGANALGEGIGGGEGIGAPPKILEIPPRKKAQPNGCRRFLQEYPGEVKPDWDAQLYIGAVLTAEDEQVMFNNLALWRQTKKWQDGYIPSAENYIRKGQWKVTPNANAMGPKEYPKEIIR